MPDTWYVCFLNMLWNTIISVFHMKILSFILDQCVTNITESAHFYDFQVILCYTAHWRLAWATWYLAIENKTWAFQISTCKNNSWPGAPAAVLCSLKLGFKISGDLLFFHMIYTELKSNQIRKLSWECYINNLQRKKKTNKNLGERILNPSRLGSMLSNSCS